MTRMAKRAPAVPGAFRAAVLGGWVVLAAAGLIYARLKHIPTWAALPALIAFLIVYPFYLVPAFPTLRERFAGKRLAPYLLVCALAPYLVCCFGAVQFRWVSLGALVVMALAPAFWYRVLPPRLPVDLAFLAIIPLLLVGKFFSAVYASIHPALKDLAFLGHASLIPIVVMVLLLERRVSDFGYGFIPRRADWRVGALHYFYFALVGFPLVLLLRAARWNPPALGWKPLPLFAGMFVAYLWTIALSEEFFARGVLQTWMEEWTNRTAGLMITSLLFGAVHLWFHAFPNWRWALVSTALAWFCGRARNQTGNIRSAMITHALVFSTWKVFFA